METAVLTFVLGIAVSVVGYLLKRWWEGQSTKESIQEAVQLANLHKEIRSGSFTLDALASLKSAIGERARTSQKYQEEIFAGIERAVEEKNKARTVEYEPQSQQEMN